MKKIWIALLIAVLFLSVIPSQAAGDPPPGLAGTLSIVTKDANTVTLYAEQTGGTPVTLTIEHYCYAVSTDDVIVNKVRFIGSITSIFNISVRTYHGHVFTPTSCWAYLTYDFSSNRQIVLAEVTTLP